MASNTPVQLPKCRSVKLANKVANQSLRSAQSMTVCHIRFENRTTRKTDILWFDYSGCAVRYCAILPGLGVNMVTFVGHPWVCRDTNSGDRLLINHKDVFTATSGTDPGSRTTMMITIPVYTLHERCLQVLSHLLPKDAICDLEIPETLKDDLAMRYDT